MLLSGLNLLFLNNKGKMSERKQLMFGSHSLFYFRSSLILLVEMPGVRGK